MQAVVAKLLAGRPADRYGDARAIRDDLECVRLGRVTQAEREGWPADGTQHDEPATERTRPPAQVDEDATRRTMRVESESPAVLLSPANIIFRPSEPRRHASPGPPATSEASLLLLACFVVGYELVIASRAERLKAEVPTVELEGIGGLWDELSGTQLPQS